VGEPDLSVEINAPAEIQKCHEFMDAMLSGVRATTLEALDVSLPPQGPITVAVAVNPWRPFDTAPKDAREILVLVDVNGCWNTAVVHYAEDLSGSEQPPYKGWFYWTGYDFAQFDKKPKFWAPIPGKPDDAVRQAVKARDKK
jgi:hypothetical protein